MCYSISLVNDNAILTFFLDILKTSVNVKTNKRWMARFLCVVWAAGAVFQTVSLSRWRSRLYRPPRSCRTWWSRSKRQHQTHRNRQQHHSPDRTPNNVFYLLCEQRFFAVCATQCATRDVAATRFSNHIVTSRMDQLLIQRQIETPPTTITHPVLLRYDSKRSIHSMTSPQRTVCPRSGAYDRKIIVSEILH